MSDDWPNLRAASAADECNRLRAWNAELVEAVDQNATVAVKLERLNAELVEALEMIAGQRQCLDNLMSDKDIARAAIAKAKGEA